MGWIVLGERNRNILLTSDKNVDAKLPRGAFLTIEEGKSKIILRVLESGQSELYSPTPMIVDLNLPHLEQDQDCKNILLASVVKVISDREDDLSDFIKPLKTARRSNQEEVDKALNALDSKGPKIFPATTHYGENKILTDGKNLITCRLPEDMFWHQTMICGTTGSGKTVASKFLCQYFVEEMKKQGAVLAINVKGIDLLQMDQKTITSNEECLKEWGDIGQVPHGIDNYQIYYPASQKIVKNLDINYNKYEKITLSVKDLDPEALNGLLTNVSDAGAQSLPDIFRYWREEVVEDDDCTFNNFLEFFNSYSDQKKYPTKNIKGDLLEVPLHHGTVSSIKKQLINASNYFDYGDAKILNSDDIVSPGKMSVIDIAWDEKSKKFGSLILRQLLHQIVERKNEGAYSDIPVLILIDEVHMFYGNSESDLALRDLDTICRTGRSLKTGVIFSTQNPRDLPKGISSVVNSKIFFRSGGKIGNEYGISLSKNELNTLKKGYAAVSIHDLPKLTLAKFPLSYGGVKEDGNDKK